MINRIERLNVLKSKVDLNDYTSSLELRDDIDSLLDEFWNNGKYLLNSDLFELDLRELCKFHISIINKVTEIHTLENSFKNEELIRSNIDMNYISKKSIDSKSASKIYCFNKEREYIFIGDLHSDDKSLKRILNDVSFFEKFILDKNQVLIFNGDYVDRGKTHLKILERLLIIKYLFPNNIMLLRGNHDGGKLLEDGGIKLPYSLPKVDDPNSYFPLYLEALIIKNKSVDGNILESYLAFFETLAYIAIVNIKNETIMAVHGGLPRPDNKTTNYYHYINSLKDLTDETIIDDLNRSMCQNIIWSDPYNGEDEYRENFARYHYKLEHMLNFKERFNMDFLIRGHQEAEKGYNYTLNDNVVTIFSSGSLDAYKNKTLSDESAYPHISPKVLMIDFNGGRKFI